jgi:hypothetical protein
MATDKSVNEAQHTNIRAQIHPHDLDLPAANDAPALIGEDLESLSVDGRLSFAHFGAQLVGKLVEVFLVEDLVGAVEEAVFHVVNI